MSLAVIDTHALLWAVAGERKRLGRDALRFLQRTERGAASLYVPTVVLVEVGEAARRAHGLEDDWPQPVRHRELPREASRLLGGDVEGVGDGIGDEDRSCVGPTLYTISERTDRLIAASAVEMDVPLLTRDPSIGAAAGVDVVW